MCAPDASEALGSSTAAVGSSARQEASQRQLHVLSNAALPYSAVVCYDVLLCCPHLEEAG